MSESKGMTKEISKKVTTAINEWPVAISDGYMDINSEFGGM